MPKPIVSFFAWAGVSWREDKGQSSKMMGSERMAAKIQWIAAVAEARVRINLTLTHRQTNNKQTEWTGRGGPRVFAMILPLSARQNDWDG